MKNRIKYARRRGFSLLELLAVMSIMAMLTTLAVTSYFSAIRGMTRRSAVKHLANTLILARQRACMEGTRVSVMIYNEVSGYDSSNKRKIAPSYVVCKEVGRISAKSGTGPDEKWIDEFAPLDKMFGTSTMGVNYGGYMRLYNLTQGKWSNVFPSVKQHEPSISSAYQLALTGQEDLKEIPMYGFVVNQKADAANQNKATWNVGDSYGIEAAPANVLPRGFEFETLPQDSDAPAVCVTFKPDGSVQSAKKIRIRTTQAPITGSSVSVDSTGSITYDEKWN